MEAFETSLNPTESNQREDPLLTRLCKGHLVAIPIESSVQDLDIKEEGNCRIYIKTKLGIQESSDEIKC